MESSGQYNFDDKYITAPMDINNFVGAAEGRAGPWIMCLCIGLGPLVFFPYLLQFLPLLAVCIPELIWFVVVLAYTVGDHRNRVAKFKALLKDENTSTYSLYNVKKIWENGCIEYVTRKVSYMIVCENSERMDNEEMSRQLELLYNQFFNRKYKVDLYFQNVEISSTLAKRYNSAKNIKDAEVRGDYIKIIDHNIHLSATKSRLMRTIILISGSRHEYKDILNFIHEALGSASTRVFKSIKLYTDQELIENIFSRDLDTYIDFSTLLRNKYKSEKFYGSKIIGYDIQNVKVTENKKINTRGFMVR